MKKPVIIAIQLLVLSCMVCCNPQKSPDKMKLITLDPGHFHAALVQKNRYPGVDAHVYVYAPAGDDLNEHLKKIEAYNTRADSPAGWKEKVYSGNDYLSKMLSEKPGNIVVLAGNNQKKTEYIKAAVDAGLNVLADKPMAINTQQFERLKDAFNTASKKKVLLYDIMTERYEITTILQREFSMLPGLFGALQKGTPDDPAITKESIHHFFKYVSGTPVKRPGWFFDVNQQGEGITDVTTHLVDLVQWECFPEQVLDYRNDIKIIHAKRWKTMLTPAQFKQATQTEAYPEYIHNAVEAGNLLGVYSNGEFIYQVKGVNAKISVTWNFQAPEGGGDTHYSMMKGTKASLVIKQGKEQNYKPQLYISPTDANAEGFESAIQQALLQVQKKYPGITLQKSGDAYRVQVPEKYHNGHEAHFGQVTEKYLQFLTAGTMPGWEVPNMLAKYYTTTKALEMAKQGTGDQ